VADGGEQEVGLALGRLQLAHDREELAVLRDATGDLGVQRRAAGRLLDREAPYSAASRSMRTSSTG